MQRAAKYIYLAWFGGSCYVTFEVFWRGRSHWTMFLLAALLFLIIGGLNEIWTSWRLIPQATAQTCRETGWDRSAHSLRFCGWH